MAPTEAFHDLEFAMLERNEGKVVSSIEALQKDSIHSDILEELKATVICLCSRDYVAALQLKTSQQILNTVCTAADVDQIINEISLLLKRQESTEVQLRHVLILFVGVACLELFIQCNWTGPKPNLDPVLANNGQANQQLLATLSQDGQPITNPLMDGQLFLLVAKVILVEFQENFTECQTACLWTLRCLAVLRQLSAEKNETTKNTIFSLMEKACSIFYFRYLSSQVHLELAYLYLYYYEFKRAREHFSVAQSNLGLKVELSGTLGKRTKFQQKDVSQLCLLVEKKRTLGVAEPLEEPDQPQNMPTDVMLNDDTLLQKVKFQDVNFQESNEPLSAFDQAVILGLTVESQKSQACHRLNTEELLAYLEVITSQPKSWCVQMMALLMRSRLEKDSRRKMERSMMQLQALVDSIENPSPKAAERQALFYSVPLPPKWTIQRDLANLLFQMGVVKGALEIFERINSWEDVVTCYQSLGWYAKAENLLREQLKINESALLWCLLGDTLKDASCYEKAWEISGHRSSRAQRSLGFIHLRNKEYAKSIPCFQKSLEINSLQEGVWFSLGCAGLATNDLEICAKAFHRCVSIDSQNAEAWNNLSHVYIKNGQKSRAHLTLQEALKGNYESWHIWENYLVVSVDVGAFNDAINAFHRMMDLRDKYCDTEILGILVKAVSQGLLDCNQKPASVLKPNLLKLMGRLTSQVTNNPDVWKLYSDLYWNGGSQEEKEKALHFLVKAQRTKTQATGWENDVTEFKDVIALTVHLSDVYVEVSQCKDNKTESLQLLSSAKLVLKQLITRAKKHHTDSLTGNIHPELSQSITDLDNSLQRITDLISSAKS
ncbi:unnamed protein product [Porites lobata]|uniref:Tetratricopeptide repeat protein 27 n=1 Tax=Porites lobata TaxID=104759 RepID=A0ABN8QNT0_9CNID|nr:unnamed protein product [Porites lobata]